MPFHCLTDVPSLATHAIGPRSLLTFPLWSLWDELSANQLDRFLQWNEVVTGLYTTHSEDVFKRSVPALCSGCEAHQYRQRRIGIAPEILVVNFVTRTTRYVVAFATNSRNYKLYFGQIQRTVSSHLDNRNPELNTLAVPFRPCHVLRIRGLGTVLEVTITAKAVFANRKHLSEMAPFWQIALISFVDE